MVRNAATWPAGAAGRRGPGLHPLARVLRPVGFSGLLVAAVLACAVAPQVFAPRDPNAVQLLARFAHR